MKVVILNQRWEPRVDDIRVIDGDVLVECSLATREGSRYSSFNNLTVTIDIETMRKILEQLGEPE